MTVSSDFKESGIVNLCGCADNPAMAVIRGTGLLCAVRVLCLVRADAKQRIQWAEVQ